MADGQPAAQRPTSDFQHPASNGAARSLLAHRRHALRQRRTHAVLRRKLCAAFQFSRRVQDGDEHGFPRQLGGGLHAGIHRCGVGRKFQRLADARGVRRHGRCADHARRDGPSAPALRHDVVRASAGDRRARRASAHGPRARLGACGCRGGKFCRTKSAAAGAH